MARALIAVAAGLPILAPTPPFEVMAMPGDVVWDDDPLLFTTHEISADRRAAHGIILRGFHAGFTSTVATEPTNRPFTGSDELYEALEYDRDPA